MERRSFVRKISGRKRRSIKISSVWLISERQERGRMVEGQKVRRRGGPRLSISRTLSLSLVAERARGIERVRMRWNGLTLSISRALSSSLTGERMWQMERVSWRPNNGIPPRRFMCIRNVDRGQWMRWREGEIQRIRDHFALNHAVWEYQMTDWWANKSSRCIQYLYIFEQCWTSVSVHFFQLTWALSLTNRHEPILISDRRVFKA